MPLNVKALALSFGATVALFMLFIGWAAAFGWGVGVVTAISSLYIGFAPTILGGIIGAIYGFIDGAIGGALIAYFYNYFEKK